MVIFHSQRIQKACADMLTMRKHGGGMTKTILWKNANPTATFAAQITAVGGTTDTTSVSFDNSKNSMGNENNNCLIPINIYGIKGKIS